ncbi:MAG: hypothetical protein IPM54_06410 [Polyangiaceae bacterium]|nr:hypothetical protein [Polyangiaceae bacterium]
MPVCRLRATASHVQKPKNVVVATHGHCFDGMASAAVFHHLVRSIAPSEQRTFRYRSCGYGPGMSMIPEAWLDGDENAILDFRYTKSPRLTWFFDHHVTGFGSVEEQNEALEKHSVEGPTRLFYEPTYSSCTKLIADVAAKHFDVGCKDLEPLIRWADIIDAARFSSAEQAVDRSEPVLQLAAVVEHHGDGAFLSGIVPKLLEKPVEEVAKDPQVARLFRPIAVAQDAFAARVRQNGVVMGSVVLVDLSDAAMDASLKFIAYALYPRCVYSVTVLRSKHHCKVSVGYNPWSGVERRHDIASICRRYDGGGHPVVGAATFPLSDVARAREVAAAIARELDS